MENKKDQVKISIKNNPDFIRMFMFILCLVFILLLTYIVWALILTKDDYLMQKSDTVESDAFFKGCNILDKDCSGSDCSHYVLCGDGTYQTCRIYDCGSAYGVFTKDMNGKIETNRQLKPDMQAIDAEKDACSGSIQTLGQTCTDGKMDIKVKILTKGQCDIKSFALIYDDGFAKPNDFTVQAGNIYDITSYYCGNVKDIIPGTKDGVALDFLTKA